LLVAESVQTREGTHLFVCTFCGRAVNQGLAALIAYRLSRVTPRTFALSANDYGIELLSAKPLLIDEPTLREVLSTNNLTDDLIACLNVSEMARRQFRDIARIAGLVFQGFPGQGKSAKQLQVSSGLMFDVLTRYDQSNLLLDQAQREVLDQQLENVRMRLALETLATREIMVMAPPKITPLGFPLWAERLQSQVISSETARERIERMVADLERAADRDMKGRTRA
jgi:ATP-dependent Lhr-like helicase